MSADRQQLSMIASDGALRSAEQRALEPIESPHHPDCPQHPLNAVFDDPGPCECRELREEDAAEAADYKLARAKED